MKNESKIIYTYKHRKIVLFLATKYNLSKELLKKLEQHDLDKMFLYLFYEKEKVSNIHRQISNHHDNEITKTNDDYIEMILDWESARYTKDDKPLNAYDTLIKYYKHLEPNILPILKNLKLDHPTNESDADVINYAKTLDEVTLDEIKKELISYIEKL